MRIQHNIMAMNAYRNYTNNVNAMKSSLEKLSSGYKINRAGDDAAGLAISEKMRAQITGLETAQKNAKDGISLVQTAEGALTEVHDMLNRMVELATMSANGTYDNTTDRAQLQKEMDQLNSEINRIADSANFNGIKLLDGSMDANGGISNTTTVFAGMKISNNTMGVAVGDTTWADSDGTKVGGNNKKGGIMISGANMTTTNTEGKKNVSDASARYHKDASTSGKTSFTIDLDGLGYEAQSGTAITGLQFVLQGGNAQSMGSGNHLALDTAGAALSYDVTTDGEGKITSEDIATAIMKQINDNDGKVYIKTGTKYGDGSDTNQTNGYDPATGNNKGGWVYVEYKVTQDGDKLKFEMTDEGYDAACAAANADASQAATNFKNTNYFQGNFNFGITYKQSDATGAGAANLSGTADNKKLQQAFAAANKDKLVGNAAACEVNEGSTPADTIYAQAYLRFTADNATKNEGTALNKTTDYIADGHGLKIGDEYYVFAGSDGTYNTKYADNVHVVDIRDLDKLLKGGTYTAGDDAANEFNDQLRTALDRLSQAAKDNEMFDVQVEQRGTMLVLNERTTYSGDANLTEKDWGLEKQIQAFESAQSSTVVEKEAGKSLTLQIGDTADDFNQLKVNIKDIHASSLGLDKIRIDDQTSAAAAVDVIKNAINMVSDIRGTLGATQNRLDHTINNLSVMQENIQDAESTIRDTDVAAEMMKYTKNNILIQSAQAMLAQANQVPQGVLQLLQ